MQLQMLFVGKTDPLFVKWYTMDRKRTTIVYYLLIT